MIIKVQDEAPFQVLTGAFTIGPSETGYELQVGATPQDFATLFSVGANTTRMVTNVANGSYFRLKNNVGEVKVNWSRTCKDGQGGGGAAGNELTPLTEFPLDAAEGTVVAYAGSSSATGVYQYDGSEWVPVGVDDLSAYWTSAQTKDYVDSADTAILAEVGELSGVVQEQQIVFSSGYNELHTQVMELSGRTVDLSGYYTSGETDAAISAATAGKADASNTWANPNGDIYFPKWNSQGIITGTKGVQQFYDVHFYRNGSSRGKIITTNAIGLGNIYAPEEPGSAGQILTPSGNTPVWVTPATINGSAITAGGNIEIQGGGGSYTAGANINISQENVISVSGLSTINGSAITDGGNIVIQGGGGGDPTTLKSVSEFNPNAENGDVQSKYVETPGLPAGVSFVTGNTYGANQDQFGGTLTIPAGFAAGTTELDPIYLMSVISNEDSTIYTLYAYENPWHPGGVMLDIYRGEREYQAPELELSLYPGGGEYGENGFGNNELVANYVEDETYQGNLIVEFYAGYNYGEGRQYADPSFDTEASTEYGLYIKAEDGWKEISAPKDVVTSSYISNIWKGTQAEYDALAPDYDPNTFYIIVSN